MHTRAFVTRRRSGLPVYAMLNFLAASSTVKSTPETALSFLLNWPGHNAYSMAAVAKTVYISTSRPPTSHE